MSARAATPVAAPFASGTRGTSYLLKAAPSRNSPATLRYPFASETRGRYVTRGRAERAAQFLSTRDREIVATLAVAKVATALQLEAMHFADLSEPSRARRRRAVLARLSEQHILQRLPRRIGGVHAGSSGFIYTLGRVGQRLARPGRRPRQAIQTTWAFLDHALATTDCLAALVIAEQDGQLQLRRFVSEPGCWLDVTSTLVLKPDALVVTNVGRDTDYTWLEVDRGTERPGLLRRKLQRYEQALRQGASLQGANVFPRVVFVVPDEARALQLHDLITRSTHPELFAVCLTEDLVPTILAGPGDAS